MKLVLASHGGLGCEMIRAVAMILGVSVLEKAKCVELLEGESLENYYEKLSKSVDGETIVLCDLFGGTPSRAALMLLQEGKVKAVLTGFNMAMVIDLLSNGASSAEDAAKSARDAGLQGIRAFIGPSLSEVTESPGESFYRKNKEQI
ncbi:hypothetical protein IG193_01870 [Infirmifilum lucidum]|uniref:PTS EIIA type-4 domain-containing protein n=1 Tax=Infirmifilum lucidum TaxID=2776706 RepID=A0A7L9FJX3_9CREN|nr:hypothetical protein [Infirmifilum lucidum]QOJ79234.1 hypothetical protein IG193_01870 [Infirmifilum lucidum]